MELGSLFQIGMLFIYRLLLIATRFFVVHSLQTEIPRSTKSYRRLMRRKKDKSLISSSLYQLPNINNEQKDSAGGMCQIPILYSKENVLGVYVSKLIALPRRNIKILLSFSCWFYLEMFEEFLLIQVNLVLW